VPLAHPLAAHRIEVLTSGTNDDGDGDGPYPYRFSWRLSR